MAYVPGFQFDLFISYAVVDNGEPAEGTDGWVDVFARQLELELQKERTHKRTVEPWRDARRIRCGDNFADEIHDALTNSAVLVVLLSKQYLASEWCQKEREIFLAAAARGAPRRRLFVVELTDPDRFDQLPAELADIQRVPLWREVGGIPQRLGHPVPNPHQSEHQPFFSRIHAVAFAIAERLDEFPAVANVPVAPPPAGPAVYLAVAPKSTKEEAFTAELRSALENAVPPVRVVQPTKLPAGGDDPQALSAALQASQLFVQVVGYGSPPRQGLQKKLADAQQLPGLFWKVEHVDVGEVEDAGLRALAQQARLGTVEEAKRAVIEKLAELTAPQAPAAGSGRSGASWFINHLPEDRELAQQAFEALSSRVDECIKRPLTGASEAELRAYFEDKLLECDHMVMVYGRASRLSANEQVRLCFKVVSSRRRASDKIIEWYVVVGPPQPPEADVGLDVSCRGFRLHAIDGRRDLAGSLERAFAQVQAGGRP